MDCGKMRLGVGLEGSEGGGETDLAEKKMNELIKERDYKRKLMK